MYARWQCPHPYGVEVASADVSPATKPFAIPASPGVGATGLGQLPLKHLREAVVDAQPGDLDPEVLWPATATGMLGAQVGRNLD